MSTSCEYRLQHSSRLQDVCKPKEGVVQRLRKKCQPPYNARMLLLQAKPTTVRQIWNPTFRLSVTSEQSNGAHCNIQEWHTGHKCMERLRQLACLHGFSFARSREKVTPVEQPDQREGGQCAATSKCELFWNVREPNLNQPNCSQLPPSTAPLNCPPQLPPSTAPLLVQWILHDFPPATRKIDGDLKPPRLSRFGR